MDRFRIVLGLALAAAAPSKGVLSQSCEVVYAGSTRNINVEETNLREVFTIYDEICTSRGEVREDKTEVDIRAVIKSAPVALTGGRTTVRDQAEYFCRSYHSTRFASSNRHIAKSEVVIDALKYFNQCRAIELRAAGEVSVRHVVVPPGSVAIHFALNAGNRTVKVSGVISENISCSSAKYLASNPAGGALSETSFFESSEDFSILCRNREEESVADGSATILKSASILVSTNYGPYDVRLPEDQRLGYRLALETKQKIDSLERQIAELGSAMQRYEQLAGRLSRMSFEHFSVVVGPQNPGGSGPRGGDDIIHVLNISQLEAVMRDKCAGAQRQAYYLVVQEGNPPYQRHSIVCTRY